MEGALLAVIIWTICGCFFIGLGIHALFSKKAVGFWANQEVFEVTNVKKYNMAVAKLFVAYGTGFIILGLPLLGGQNSAKIVIPILGTVAETIMAMALYITVIEKKYKRK